MNPFSHNDRQQFIGEEFFGKHMTVVVDTNTALQALETIVDQGEGSIGVPDSHYSIFVELFQRRMEWECIDYIDKPETAKYGNNKVAYHVCYSNSLCCSLYALADTVTDHSSFRSGSMHPSAIFSRLSTAAGRRGRR